MATKHHLARSKTQKNEHLQNVSQGSKIISNLLLAVGISRNLSPLCWFFITLFHVSNSFLIYTRVRCLKLTEMEASLCFKIVMLCVRILDTILWWQMFLRRKQLHKLTVTLLSQKVNKCKLFVFIIVYFLTLTDAIPFIVNQITRRRGLVQNPCRNILKLIQDSAAHRIFFLFDELTPLYMNVGITFVTTSLYCTYCLIILQHIRTITETKSMKGFLKTWKNISQLFPLIKDFENVMALPLFLAICKIVLLNSSAILMIAGNSKYKPVKFVVVCGQLALSFVVVVTMADMVQKRCMAVVESVFFNLRKLNEYGVHLNYFDYLEMEKNCTLTAWNILHLNRKLILTAVTASVTYGVIIAQVTT